jgi:hypothetical protein
VSEFQEYENVKNEIRMLMYTGQYDLALTEMDRLRKQIKHRPNTLEELWFVTYNTGWIYYKKRQ